MKEQKQLLVLEASEEEKSSHRQMVKAPVQEPQPEPEPEPVPAKKGKGAAVAVIIILLLLAAAGAALYFFVLAPKPEPEPEPEPDTPPVVPVEVVDDRGYGDTHDHDYWLGFSEYQGDREIADYSAPVSKWTDINGRTGTYIARWTAPGLRPYGFELENGMKTMCGVSFGPDKAYADDHNPAETLLSSSMFMRSIENTGLQVEGKTVKVTSCELTTTNRRDINGWKMYQFNGFVKGTVVTWDMATQRNAPVDVALPFSGYGVPLSSFDYDHSNPNRYDGFAWCMTIDPAHPQPTEELAYVALNTAMSFRIQKCDETGKPFAEYEFDYSSRMMTFENADADDTVEEK